MSRRIQRSTARLRAAFDGFKRLSSRYWWLYPLAAAVYELVLDRALGWVNAKLDEIAIGFLRCVSSEVLYSPMILIVMTMIALFVYAFFRPDAAMGATVNTDDEIESEGVLWVWNEQIDAWPHCLEHRSMLQLKYTSGVVGPLRGGVFIGDVNDQIPSGFQERAELFCSMPLPDGHTFKLERSRTVSEAQHRIRPVRERHLAERAAAKTARRR